MECFAGCATTPHTLRLFHLLDPYLSLGVVASVHERSAAEGISREQCSRCWRNILDQALFPSPFWTGSTARTPRHISSSAKTLPQKARRREARGFVWPHRAWEVSFCWRRFLWENLCSSCTQEEDIVALNRKDERWVRNLQLSLKYLMKSDLDEKRPNNSFGMTLLFLVPMRAGCSCIQNLIDKL